MMRAAWHEPAVIRELLVTNRDLTHEVAQYKARLEELAAQHAAMLSTPEGLAPRGEDSAEGDSDAKRGRGDGRRVAVTPLQRSASANAALPPAPASAASSSSRWYTDLLAAELSSPQNDPASSSRRTELAAAQHSELIRLQEDADAWRSEALAATAERTVLKRDVALLTERCRQLQGIIDGYVAREEERRVVAVVEPLGESDLGEPLLSSLDVASPDGSWRRRSSRCTCCVVS